MDVQICFRVGRKIEMSALEEIKGLSRTASSKGTCRFARQKWTTPPLRTQKKTVFTQQPFPSASLQPSAEDETLVLPECYGQKFNCLHLKTSFWSERSLLKAGGVVEFPIQTVLFGHNFALTSCWGPVCSWRWCWWHLSHPRVKNGL